MVGLDFVEWRTSDSLHLNTKPTSKEAEDIAKITARVSAHNYPIPPPLVSLQDSWLTSLSSRWETWIDALAAIYTVYPAHQLPSHSTQHSGAHPLCQVETFLMYHYYILTLLYFSLKKTLGLKEISIQQSGSHQPLWWTDNKVLWRMR